MIGSRALVNTGAALALACAGLALCSCGATATRASATDPAAQARTHAASQAASLAAVTAADSFLRTYVRANGQVIRTGDGDDTVSEGQAYGLLIAQVAGRPAEFARIWRWTAAHLQRPSGLLAWHASRSGAVIDAQPASDADLLTAWALSRERGAGASVFHAAARRMAKAILANEVVKSGPTLLAAGPWATGSPASLDPSYWAPVAFTSLASFTHASKFTALAAKATAYTQRLTADGNLLPPDWAHLEGSTVIANPAPDGSAHVIQYGLDAQRLTIWMATSCLRGDRRLAAAWWKLLSPPSHQGALALAQNGSVIDAKTSALGYAAAAAAAQAGATAPPSPGCSIWRRGPINRAPTTTTPPGSRSERRC